MHNEQPEIMPQAWSFIHSLLAMAAMKNKGREQFLTACGTILLGVPTTSQL